MPRGSVQTLAQTCEGFAAGMIKFCETMGWGCVVPPRNGRVLTAF
jgi:DNA polymerase theta